MLLTTIAGGSAFASTVSAAGFTGGSGTVTVGGTLYSKNGGALTLTITTSSDTKCVQITGAHTARQTSDTAKSSWTFNFTAGNGDGVQTITAAASPNFNQNNCNGQSQSPKSASYTLDNTGPALRPSNTDKSGVSPAPNAAGWNNSNVSITWSATDAGSGVATGPTPATASQTANTPLAGQTFASSAADGLGNGGNGSVTIKLDKANPTVSAVPTPPPNANGWNNSNVSLLVTCADGLSGIKSCSGGGTVLLQNEGANQSVSVTATDVADNSVTQSVGGVNIDKTVPSLSGASTTSANANGWFNGDVTIHWTCGDNLSGLAGACPADSTIGGEGSGLYDTKTISDKAGNATQSDSAKVNIDRHAPVTNATAPPAWNNTDVSVTLDGNDGLSGVAATYYTINGGAQQTYSDVAKPTFDAEGTYTLAYWSVDNAGNEEAHHSIQVGIDKTPPTISHTLTPAPNGNGWNNADTTIHFICSDALSGISSCTPDHVVASEGESQSILGVGVDSAGNDATDPASVSLDKTPPTINASADRAPNGSGWYNDDVVVSFQCGDALSGVDTCPSPKTVGEGADQTASATVNDNAGNSSSASVSNINVDKTAPTLSGAATAGPNGNNGWYTSDVTIDWSCSDNLSGIAASCPANDVVSGEGEDLGASASVSDVAGNTTNAVVSGIKIDRHAPNTTPSLSAPVAAGWYGPAGAHVTLNGFDPLSAVDATYYRVDGGSPIAYAGPFTFDDNGVHTINFWSVDKAGNVEDATSGANSITVHVDKIDPTIQAIVPPANGNGWYMSPVVVSFNCDDDGSGIATCTEPITLGEGANQSAEGHAKDTVGNTTMASVGGINVDLTPPTLTGTPATSANGNGWYKGDVTIQWNCSDALSGIDGPCPADSLITGEGANLGAGPVSVLDKAGNSTTSSVNGIDIDRSAPTITASRAPAANAAGWNNTDVTISFDCGDSLSGIDVCPGAQTFGEGDNQSASGTAIDKAGNSASHGVSGIRVDKTKPTITASATKADATAYDPGSWTKQSVTVHFSCSDALSGLATACPADVTVSASTDAAGQVVSGSVSDKAGNSDSAQLLVRVDKGDPSVSIASPANGASTVATSVTVTGTASDALSGLASVSVNGAPAGLTGGNFGVTVPLTCGSNTITALATDNVGNTATASVNVTRVCYSATYFQPLDMSSGTTIAQNTVKYGRVVPVKVQVLNVDGVSQSDTQINAPTILVGRLPSCTAATVDSIEESFDAGAANNNGTAFRWDPIAAQWIYNLDTKAMNLSTSYCYRIDIKLDGNVISTSKWAVLKTLK